MTETIRYPVQAIRNQLDGLRQHVRLAKIDVNRNIARTDEDAVYHRGYQNGRVAEMERQINMLEVLLATALVENPADELRAHLETRLGELAGREVTGEEAWGFVEDVLGYFLPQGSLVSFDGTYDALFDVTEDGDLIVRRLVAGLTLDDLKRIAHKNHVR